MSQRLVNRVGGRIRPTCSGVVDMIDFLAKIGAHVLSWTFVIGMAGSVCLVIPITAYQLLKALLEKDRPEEINPSLHSG